MGASRPLAPNLECSIPPVSDANYSPKSKLSGRSVVHLGHRMVHPFTHACQKTAQAVANFMKNKWGHMLAYLAAWGLIILCSGLLYGFQAVALPLTIGISCGLAFGIVVGVFTFKFFDPKNEHRGKNSCWGLINSAIEYLDENGTKQILLPVAVTLILSTAVVFPIAMGVIFGIFLGNQFAIQVGYPEDELAIGISKLNLVLDGVKQEIDNVNSQYDNQKITSTAVSESIANCDQAVKKAFDDCVFHIKPTPDTPIQTFSQLCEHLRKRAIDHREKHAIALIKVHEENYRQATRLLRLELKVDQQHAS